MRILAVVISMKMHFLAATNKWLIGHAEGGLDDSAYIGLKGENIEI